MPSTYINQDLTENEIFSSIIFHPNLIVKANTIESVTWGFVTQLEYEEKEITSVFYDMNFTKALGKHILHVYDVSGLNLSYCLAATEYYEEYICPIVLDIIYNLSLNIRTYTLLNTIQGLTEYSSDIQDWIIEEFYKRNILVTH